MDSPSLLDSSCGLDGTFNFVSLVSTDVETCTPPKQEVAKSFSPSRPETPFTAALRSLSQSQTTPPPPVPPLPAAFSYPTSPLAGTPDLLIDFSSTPPPASIPVSVQIVAPPPPLLLASPSRQRAFSSPIFVASTVPRSPSPLKRVTFDQLLDGDDEEEGEGEEDWRGEREISPFASDVLGTARKVRSGSESGSGSGEDDVSISPSTSRGAVPSGTGRKWGVMVNEEKRRARSRSVSPVKDVHGLGGLSPVKEDDASFAFSTFATSDYSLIVEERGSFLLSDDANFTLNSFSLPTVGEDEEEDYDSHASADMRNLLRGLGNSLIGGRAPSSLLLPPTAQTTKAGSALFEGEQPPSSAHEKSLLAASTASYREYRDSPARPRAVSEEAEKWSEGEEKTPMRHHRLDALHEGGTPTSAGGSSGTGSGTESSGDVAAMLRNWRGDEMATKEIREQDAPTGVLRTEPTMTFEIGSPTPSAPSQPRHPVVVVSPKSLFSAMKGNASRPLERVATGSPRRPLVTNSAQSTRRSKFTTLDQPTRLTSAPELPPPVLKPALQRTESATERLRKKIEELNRKKTAPVPPPQAPSSSQRSSSISRPRPSVSSPLIARTPAAPRPSIARTPLGTQSRSRPSIAPASVRRLDPIPDDDSVFGDLSKENKAPPPSRSAPPLPALKSTPATPGSSSRTAHPAIPPPKLAGSPRKESTQERLDRAKEERKRREGARSPERPVASSLSSSFGPGGSSSSIPARRPLGASSHASSSKLAKLALDTAVPRFGASKPPRTSAPASPRPATSLAESLATRTSLASRSQFNPASSRSVGAAARPSGVASYGRVGASRPPPTLSTSTSSSNASSTFPSTSSSSVLPRPSIGTRATSPPKGLRRPSTVTGASTGMQVPRARVAAGIIGGDDGPGVRSGVPPPRSIVRPRA